MSTLKRNGPLLEIEIDGYLAIRYNSIHERWHLYSPDVKRIDLRSQDNRHLAVLVVKKGYFSVDIAVSRVANAESFCIGLPHRLSEFKDDSQR